MLLIIYLCKETEKLYAEMDRFQNVVNKLYLWRLRSRTEGTTDSGYHNIIVLTYGKNLTDGQD